MPSMANITVKKNDGTTDITYTTVSPAGGDNSPAVWRSNSVGSALAHRPELRLTFREGRSGAARVGRGTYVYPQIATNSTTSVTDVVQKARFAVDWDLPKAMSATDIAEAVSQFANLLASTLLKDAGKEGVAPS